MSPDSASLYRLPDGTSGNCSTHVKVAGSPLSHPRSIQLNNKRQLKGKEKAVAPPPSETDTVKRVPSKAPGSAFTTFKSTIPKTLNNLFFGKKVSDPEQSFHYTFAKASHDVPNTKIHIQANKESGVPTRDEVETTIVGTRRGWEPSIRAATLSDHISNYLRRIHPYAKFPPYKTTPEEITTDIHRRVEAVDEAWKDPNDGADVFIFDPMSGAATESPAYGKNGLDILDETIGAEVFHEAYEADPEAMFWEVRSRFMVDEAICGLDLADVFNTANEDVTRLDAWVTYFAKEASRLIKDNGTLSNHLTAANEQIASLGEQVTTLKRDQKLLLTAKEAVAKPTVIDQQILDRLEELDSQNRLLTQTVASLTRLPPAPPLKKRSDTKRVVKHARDEGEPRDTASDEAAADEPIETVERAPATSPPSIKRVEQSTRVRIRDDPPDDDDDDNPTDDDGDDDGGARLPARRSATPATRGNRGYTPVGPLVPHRRGQKRSHKVPDVPVFSNDDSDKVSFD
ncbi:hypothetical protein N0V85_009312, partial [Neurospora sp. IMI 360204]